MTTGGGPSAQKRYKVTLWTETGPPEYDATGVEVEIVADTEEAAIHVAEASHQSDWADAVCLDYDGGVLAEIDRKGAES